MRGLSWDKTRSRWFIQFTRKSGRIHRERLPSGTTKKQAETYLIKLREDDRLGLLVTKDELRESQPETISLSEFVMNSYAPYVQAHNKPSTLKTKAYHWGNLAGFFGDVPVDAVTRPLFVAYQGERKRDGVKDRTVNAEMATLRHILQIAHELGLVPHPPPRVRRLAEKDKKEHRWLSLEEAEQALRNAADRGAHWHALTLFLLHTGARWNEIRQLLWSDVDLERAIVHFRAGTTKNSRPRQVPLLPEVVEALQSIPHDLPHVFAKETWDGWVPLGRESRISQGKVKRYPWEQEDPDYHFGPHVFRHTFATWKLQTGIQVQIVQAWLGHATIQQTVDTYGHIQPAEHRAEIERGHRPETRRLRVVGEDE